MLVNFLSQANTFKGGQIFRRESELVEFSILVIFFLKKIFDLNQNVSFDLGPPPFDSSAFSILFT